MELTYIKNDIKRERGKIVCPHNPEGVRCLRLECYKCGWNPKVGEPRKAQILQKLGVVV